MIASPYDPKCKVDGEARGKDNAIVVTMSNTRPPSGLRVMKIVDVDPLDDGLDNIDEVAHGTCAQDDKECGGSQ